MSFEVDIKKAYALIDTNRKIVGVKLIASEEEYNSYNVTPLINPLSYCVAVKSATLGHSIKFNYKTSGCGGSTRVLGLVKPSSDYYNGTEGFKLGLYKDKNLARQCANQIIALDKKVYGVVAQPIECFNETSVPDVVIIICKPRECMRIMQGYAFNFGVTKSICMSGNQGICSEITAYPLINNTINVSFLCSGTRYLANWDKDEAAAGMPFTIFSEVIDGIYKTINPIEMDKRKHQIQKNLQEAGFNDLSIEYGKTYYTELEKVKREKRKNETYG